MKLRSALSKLSCASAFALGTMLTLSPAANAMKLKQQNLQEMAVESQSIITGQVVSVTDGFDNNRPYTEVTIQVSSDAKGKLKDDTNYTFRQFGLIKPRSMDNGKVYLGATPEGFSKWREGEQVIAFMYKPASITGFQTTVGLAQGKFVVRNGKVENIFANKGVFEGLDTSSLSAEQQNLLTTPGAVDVGVFMDLVGELSGVQQ